MNNDAFSPSPSGPMNSQDFAAFGAPKTVYVREVGPDAVREVIGDETDIPTDARFFAVHAADGTRMAIVDDRDAAFAGARQYDLDPVSVH
ncbi:MAG: DUF1150 family protein [Candidatus Phaeomarinobacter sp.]